MRIRFEFHVHLFKNKTQKRKESAGRLTTTQSDLLFSHVARNEAQLVLQAHRVNTYNNYMTAMRSFMRFLGRDIPVRDINSHTVEMYERWLKDHDICMNTISCYMRSLRSILNKSGLVGTENANLFKGVFTGTSKTEKRAISDDEIVRFRNLKARRNSFEELTRDVFLFSFYAMGMPFVDVAFLKKDQIQHGKIIYFRHKTGQRITIRLEPCMITIIRKYQHPYRNYVFPIIHADDPNQAFMEYLGQLGKYNRTLKRLARKANIITNLTSYVVRHTWASLAYQSNVELPVISKALGHTNTATTMVYIKEINDLRLENANRLLIRKTMRL